MKKHIIIITTIAIILLSFLGCEQITGDPQLDTTTPAITTYEMPNETILVFGFDNLKDFETYMLTRSENNDDYDIHPMPPFSTFPDEVKNAEYFSLTNTFALSEYLFESSSGAIRLNEDYTVWGYEYALDKISVNIEMTDIESAKEYLLEKESGLSNDDFSAYQAGQPSDAKYLVRAYKDTEVIYEIEDGIKAAAIFVSNGVAIEINGVRSFWQDMTSEDLYQEFMTAEKYAHFSAFFSDDPEVFAAGVERVAENLKNR